MRSLLLPLLALAFPASTVAGDVAVSYGNGRVDVTARAPLSEVLDRLGKQTGMKVVYDGTPPRMLVTANLKGVTPARAVHSLLEAQNVGYAATTDATGTTVTMLVLVAGNGASRPTAVAAAAHAPDPAMAEPDYEESMPEPEPEMEPEPEPEPVADQKEQRPDAPAAMPGAWPGAQGQPGVFVPFPQPGAAPPDSKPPEPPQPSDQPGNE